MHVTDRQTDRQTDGTEFTGTHVHRTTAATPPQLSYKLTLNDIALPDKSSQSYKASLVI